MFPAKPSSVPSGCFFSHSCDVFCGGVRCNCDFPVPSAGHSVQNFLLCHLCLMVCQLGVFPRIPPSSDPLGRSLWIGCWVCLVHCRWSTLPCSCYLLWPASRVCLLARLPAAFWEALQFWKSLSEYYGTLCGYRILDWTLFAFRI